MTETHYIQLNVNNSRADWISVIILYRFNVGSFGVPDAFVLMDHSIYFSVMLFISVRMGDNVFRLFWSFENFYKCHQEISGPNR